MAGMIVPRYWAEASVRERREGRQVTVRRWGWSDDGPEKAQAHADSRAREALQRILSGDKIPRRELKVAYNGAEGVPIREEIVSRHGETIVTRNGYGALCINTPDVLFADIDFGDPKVPCLVLLGAALTAAAATALLASAHRFMLGIAALMGSLVLLPLALKLFHRGRVSSAGGVENFARGRVARFVKAHPDWKVRVYRTPAGLRVLVVHRRFDPTSPEVAEFFRALGSDPLYVRMCVRQRCFRARVSPKPWRIGIPGHMKPRPGVWPVNPERKVDRDRWIAAYQTASQGHASCRYLESLGNGAEDPAAEAVRALHDDLGGALTSLPLA